MVKENVKYFKKKPPLWARILLIGVFFVFSAIVLYALYKDSKISLGAGVLIHTFVTACLFFLDKFTSKEKQIEIHQNFLLIPGIGRKTTRVDYSDIHSASEQVQQGVMSIRLERKNAGVIFIQSTNLNENDYCDLLEELTVKFPETKEENPYFKNKKKFAYAILIGLPMSILAYGFYKSGYNDESIKRFLLMPVLIGGLTALGSKATKKIAEYYRKNRDFLNKPEVKKRRTILNFIMGTSIVLMLAIPLILMPYKDGNTYLSIKFLILGVSFSLLLFFLVDRGIGASEFVSIWERGCYFICFLLFGTIFIVLSLDALIFMFRDPGADQLATAKIVLSSSSEKEKCYKPDVSEVLGPIQFCTQRFPKIKEGDEVSYKLIKKSLGLNLYYSFELKK